MLLCVLEYVSFSNKYCPACSDDLLSGYRPRGTDYFDKIGQNATISEVKVPAIPPKCIVENLRQISQ